MSISVDTLVTPLLGEGYSPAPGIYDEMSSAPGVYRPHWDAYVASLSELGREELARRWNTARQRIRENGVTYNVYGDPLGMDRPWNLDAIPILISPTEWRDLEAGLIQRARLLNWMLADLYGAAEAAARRPPSARHRVRKPGILAALPRPPACRTTRYLHLLAVDLARSADGQWWVLSDRLAGAFRRGLRARKPHRPGGDFSGSVPRIPGPAAGFVFPRLPQQPAASVACHERAIRGLCC